MVFCRECERKVEDCVHFVAPLNVEAVEVFDPKVKTLAYKKDDHVLEIAFKNGQTWQLFGVKPDIYEELLHATLSSFLRLIAHRYKAAPVRKRPAEELCPACKRPMTAEHQTSGHPARTLWHCARCNQSLWRTTSSESIRERKTKWH